MSGFVSDAEIKAHVHDDGKPGFFCYCAAYHRWGERGTLTVGRPIKTPFQLIKCACETWHYRAIGAQDAENIIKEES